jgi:transcription termination factor Rho
MHLKDLKSKSPAELLKIAEELKIENAGTLRKQDMIFAILKQMAQNKDAIYGEGVLEILQDGFGFFEIIRCKLSSRTRRYLCFAITNKTK